MRNGELLHLDERGSAPDPGNAVEAAPRRAGALPRAPPGLRAPDLRALFEEKETRKRVGKNFQ